MPKSKKTQTPRELAPSQLAVAIVHLALSADDDARFDAHNLVVEADELTAARVYRAAIALVTACACRQRAQRS